MNANAMLCGITVNPTVRPAKTSLKAFVRLYSGNQVNMGRTFLRTRINGEHISFSGNKKRNIGDCE